MTVDYIERVVSIHHKQEKIKSEENLTRARFTNVVLNLIIDHLPM